MTEEDNETRANDHEETTKSLIETVFPNQATNVLKIAFAFAGLLILFPFILIWLAPAVIAPYQVNILICVGIALLFAATGTQATLRIGGVVLAGGAAIAIAAFLILESHRVDQENRDARKREYVRGHLSDIEKEYAVRIDVGKPVLGFPLYKESIYEFAVFRNDIDRQIATVEFDRKKQETKESAVLQNVTISIPRSCIENMLGQSIALDWQVKHVRGNDQTDQFVIYDLVQNKEIGRFPPRPEESGDRYKCDDKARASNSTWDAPPQHADSWWSLLPIAWAQGAASISAKARPLRRICTNAAP